LWISIVLPLLAASPLWAAVDGIPPTRLSLSKLLEQVHAHPEIKADALQVDSTEVDRRAAILKFGPNVNLMETWSSTSGSYTFAATSDSWGSNSQSINVNFNLFRGFQDVSSYKSQSFLLDASREDRRHKYLEASRQASETFFTCLQLEQSETEARTALDLRRQIAQIERNRFEKGVHSRDEVAKLDLDANNAELELQSILSRKRSCVEQLAYWSGPIEALEATTLEPVIKDQLSREAVAPPDLTHHPDLLSAQLNREYAHWDVRRARGAFYPTLDFAYSEFPTTAFQMQSQQWLLTAQFTLFDSGVTLEGLEKAHVLERIADERQQYTQRQLDSTAKQRLEDVHAAFNQYVGQKKNADLAQQLLNSSLRRFRAGTLSANDVALDQGRVIQSLFAVHNTWLQMHITWIRYQVALGHTLEEFAKP
jgi:outer membrane protein TolC